MEASDYLVKATDYIVEDSDYTQIAKTDSTEAKKDIFLTKIAKFATKKNIENSFFKLSISSSITLAIIFLLGVLILWRVIFIKKSKYLLNSFYINESSTYFNLTLKKESFDYLETFRFCFLFDP
jgi:hypothetical protein